MGPEGNILVDFPITTFQPSLTHSAMWVKYNGTKFEKGLSKLLYVVTPRLTPRTVLQKIFVKQS